MIPGTSSISIDVNGYGGGSIDAHILGLPLSADERTTLMLQMDAPGEGEPELGVRQVIDGEVIGGSFYRPPQPFEIYLPLVLRNSG